MNVPLLTTSGTKEGEVELPIIFKTDFRKELIHKAFIHLNSHKFQPQGRHPTAGMDVVARSNDPPTGQGTSRIAKMRGGGGGRQGEAGGVASVKGGRQAHPPIVKKIIYKKLNKKENKLIESITKTRDMMKILNSLNLLQDVQRLNARKPRTGKSALRGRGTKIGKSILFVVSKSEKLSRACNGIPGIDVKLVKDLSVLDLAPGAAPIRLTVYSKNAINEISKIKSPHLELMVTVK